MEEIGWTERSWGPGVQVGSVRADGRLLIWAPVDAADGSAPSWDRIMVDAPTGTSSGGLRSAAAAAFRVRRRPPAGWLAGIAMKLKGRGGEDWSLPDGTPVDRLGGRRSDLLFVWSEDDPGLSEDEARARWPTAAEVRRIGEGAFLLEGVGGPAPAEPDRGGPETPVESARRNLEEARRGGDIRAQAVASADLGMLLVSADQGAAAAERLHEAAGLFRTLGDPAREADALSGLGHALATSGRPHDALHVLDAAYALAERAGDPYARKLALERIAVARSHLRDPAGALAALDEALRATRALGDRHQEARLLWMQAIALGELGRRDAAAARAEESTALMRGLGKPEAAWYDEQLRRYREEASILSPASLFGPVRDDSTSDAPSGAGLLRMAFSATKAMAAFVGSGFKTTPTGARASRLEACRRCEHHTGMRCRVCGCLTEAKSRMAHERCPLGKWPE